MSLDGNLQPLNYSEIKALCFVSESGPARLFSEYTSFERRPKVPGLWVRFLCKDGDSLEGILSHNLAEWPESGFLAVPPRAGSLRQRVFLPRLSVAGTELRGIIGKPMSIRQEKKSVSATSSVIEGQLSMFDQLSSGTD